MYKGTGNQAILRADTVRSRLLNIQVTTDVPLEPQKKNCKTRVSARFTLYNRTGRR